MSAKEPDQPLKTTQDWGLNFGLDPYQDHENEKDKEDKDTNFFLKAEKRQKQQKPDEERDQTTTNMTYQESDSSILEIKHGIERLNNDYRYPILDDLLKN